MEHLTAGDWGTLFEFTVYDGSTPIPIGDATTLDPILTYPKPHTRTKTLALAFKTDGSDGKLVYTTVSGDFDEPGTWTGRVRVEGPGYRRTSQVFHVRVAAA